MNDNEDVPIRDAATVILLREKKDSTYVLMGQRGNKAVFMPSKYVFPGGAVDEDDANVELFKSINKKGIDLLHQYSEKKIAKELSVAAIRELWEEAGLRLCAKVENIVNVSPGWEDFCNGCYLPDTQNIKNTYLQYRSAYGEEYAEKMGIMGALSLYLNFLNMFMFLLQFMGNGD